MGKRWSIWRSLALCSLGLFGRGVRSERNPEPRSGRAACSCILRPSGEGRRLRAQRRIVRRREVREHRGGVQRGGVPRAAVSGSVATWRLEHGGKEDGAPEALAVCQLWACSGHFLARPV